MNLLLDEVDVLETTGDPSAVDVRGIAHDSRQVAPGRSLLLPSRPGHRRARPRRRGGGPGGGGDPLRAPGARAVRPPGGAGAGGAGASPAGHGPPGRRLLGLPRPRPADGRGDRDQRQDQRDPPDRGGARSRRSPDHRRGHPVGDPDHAGGDRAPAVAAGPRRRPGRRRRRRRRRRRPAGGRGHGGVQPRPGPVPGGRRPLRRGRLHQPQPRPPRLPRHHGGVLRRQGVALRRPSAPSAGW